jgi:hypothetical protein
MKPEPFSFEYPVADFDLTRLPVDAGLLGDNPAMLATAVQGYYEECFRKLGGSPNKDFTLTRHPSPALLASTTPATPLHDAHQAGYFFPGTAR